jgi:hypothetical protein
MSTLELAVSSKLPDEQKVFVRKLELLLTNHKSDLLLATLSWSIRASGLHSQKQHNQILIYPLSRSVNRKWKVFEREKFVHLVVKVDGPLRFGSIFSVHVVAEIFDKFTVLFELFQLLAVLFS